MAGAYWRDSVLCCGYSKGCVQVLHTNRERRRDDELTKQTRLIGLVRQFIWSFAFMNVDGYYYYYVVHCIGKL